MNEYRTRALHPSGTVPMRDPRIGNPLPEGSLHVRADLYRMPDGVVVSATKRQGMMTIRDVMP